MKTMKKNFTRQDVVKAADAVMGLIKTKLDATTDIAEVVIDECWHRICAERKLRFYNSPT